jgi:tetratricopeptide (TPR) repeat protein
MSAVLPENAFVSDKRIVSTDRYIDHFYELLVTTNDARDVQNYYLRALQRVCAADPRVAALTGVLPEPPEEDTASFSETGLSEAIRREIEEATIALLARQKTLHDISDSLEHLHQSALQKIRREANTALANGMRTGGRDRVEDFKDALRLFRTIQEDAVSGRDYAVWFNVGWLLWKLEENLPEAEEAFYQASRLSVSAGDQYHALSLRHLAYLQYLQAKIKPAHATLVKGLAANPEDPDTLYDGARYAARVGRQAEAMSLIDRCFDRNPLLLTFAFTEPDFVETGLDAAIAELLKTKREQVIGQIKREASRWATATAAASEAAARAEAPIDLPAELREAADPRQITTHLGEADFFTVHEVARRVIGKADAIRQTVQVALDKTIASFDAEAERVQKQFEKLQQDRDTWRTTVKWLEKEANQAGYSLQSKGPLENIKLRLQKRHDRVMTARLNYSQSKDNLAQSTSQLKELAPGLQRQIKQINERKSRVEATRDWFLGQEF